MTHHDPTRHALAISPIDGHEHLFALGDAPDLDVFRRRLDRRLITIGAPAVRENRRRGVGHPGDELLFYTPTAAYIANACPVSWEVAPHPLLTLERVHHWDVHELHVDPARLSMLRALRSKLARKRRHADALRPRVPVRHHRERGSPSELRARISGLEFELDRALSARRHYSARGEPPAWHLAQLVYPQRTPRGDAFYFNDGRHPLDHAVEHVLRWHTSLSFVANPALFTFMNR